MKLQRNTEVATGEGFEAVADFGFEMNDKAFTVLSDTIYKDKIGSIVRELSCNAFDAHIEAGTPDVPFEIHLPDAFEPYFVIRDFGPGISRDDIKKVYTKYFASTKDDSNDVVGAFGLGSKTPFAYTDAFTVISIHDGIKTMYNAHKSKGLPSIVAYGKSEPTDEPNGLEVRVSVEAQDYKAFASAVKRQLKFFPVKPTITNGDIEWETYTPILEVQGFTYYKIDGANNRPMYGYHAHRPSHVTQGLFIKQGPVAYPVDFDSMNQVLDSKGVKTDAFYRYLRDAVSSSYSGKGIIIDMPIGTVEVTASREGISYKDATVQNIMTRLNQIAKRISSEVVVTLDKAYKDGVLNFVNVMDALDGYFKHTLNAEDMEKRYPKFKFYNSGYGVTARLKADASVFEDVEIRKYDIVNYTQPRANQAKRMSAAPVDPNDPSKGHQKTIPLDLNELAGKDDLDGNTNVVYIKDIPNGFVARLKEYNSGSHVILLETPNGVGKDDIQQALGNEFTVRNVSELPKVASQRKNSGGHSTTGGRQRLWFNLPPNKIGDFGVFRGHETLYAASCSQVFGESFDEAEDDKYAYFTTFNNKFDNERSKMFHDSSNMVELFSQWLNEQGYTTVAIAERMVPKAEKTGKFHSINALWEQHKEQFKKETWDMFLVLMLANYYHKVKENLNRPRYMYGHTGQHSVSSYNNLFSQLGMTEHNALAEQANELEELSLGSGSINSAMESVIRENMGATRIAQFEKVAGYLDQNYSSDRVKGSLEEVEDALEQAGAVIKVKASELIDGYIKLIKDNLSKLILMSTVDGPDGKSLSLNKMNFAEVFDDDKLRLSSDEIIKLIKTKVGVGA